MTARRRDETSIAVPVVLTAVGAAELQRRGISNADALAQLVPGLTILGSGGSIQGGTIALRGVAGPDTNPLGDQAVSFNIDSVQIAKSSVRRLAFMDLQQVEVLKGPQALFFGKNSPAGIISLRTADPTSHLAAKASLGYEINAHEWRGEGFVSGPLTETLGARLAFYGSDMRGWVKSLVPANSIFPPFHRFGPRNREWAVRGTLKFDPTDAFSARLKLSYGKANGASNANNAQVVNCPTGTTQLVGVVSDCKADNHNNRTDNIGTVFTPYEPRFGNGETFSKSDQILAGLEMNYKLNDAIDLTSVTGFYRNKVLNSDHFATYPVVPILNFGSVGLPQLVAFVQFKHRQISQELRANSHFDGPLNFTLGGIYTDTRSSSGSHAFGNATNPVEVVQYLLAQDGTAYSVFGQARLDVTPQLELSAGGRYSYEKKTLPVALADFTGSRTNPMLPFAPAVDRVSFNNFSPELTATYRPTSRLTFFGSYKHGFLSGGFNGSTATFTVPINYGPQKIKGFEGGVKAALLDGALRTNLSVFNYKVTGLQVTAFEGTLGTIRNAGGVRTKGAEFDMSYRTPIEGLTLRGALNYNHARYTENFEPCWRGQSQAQGCNFRAIGGGKSRPILPGETGNNQDLSGRRLINAPDWAGNVGASYETPLGSALKLGLSADVDFASSSPHDATLFPLLVSPKYALVGATARIAEAEDAWEVAVIGRNLTEKYYWAGGQQLQFTGGISGAVAPGVPADAYAVPNRGREIMLRVTVAFGQ
ncbi:TonB-dependent receptor [Rhizorhabdus argentea]|uniref:TonB-dependent receptor n=1 Tax=Rhizorhabdus argentea TaxID=1387174 RepID=UPI0030EBE578